MDRFDLAVHGDSNAAVLKRSRVERALIIGVESDTLAKAFADAGTDTHYAPLDCIEGTTRS